MKQVTKGIPKPVVLFALAAILIAGARYKYGSGQRMAGDRRRGEPRSGKAGSGLFAE